MNANDFALPQNAQWQHLGPARGPGKYAKRLKGTCLLRWEINLMKIGASPIRQV